MKKSLFFLLLFTYSITFSQDPQLGWSFNYEGDDFSDEALLDLRCLNEDNAGDHGFIRLSPDGKYFVNDQGEIRFWATNGGQLIRNHNPELSDDDLATYAKFLSKMGVNMIRYHGEMFSIINDVNAPNIAEANYIWRVVAAMKKEGIYTTISPFWPAHIKQMPEAWGMDDYIGEKDPWALLYFNEKFRNAYKSWVSYLYTEVNPYTGFALKDDPAVAIIQILNEDGLFFWTVNAVLPSLKVMMQNQFFEWAIKKYSGLNALMIAWENTQLPGDDLTAEKLELISLWHTTDDPDVPKPSSGFTKRLTDQMHFFAEVQRGCYQELQDHYRNIGCNQLINASNWKTASPNRLFDLERWTNLSSEVMAVNRYMAPGHFGPNSGWRIERHHHYQGKSVMHTPHRLPINIKQVTGKPFIVSESGWNLPNQYQAEGPFLVAAYQSLTGIDAFYWFNPSSTTYEEDPYWPYFGKINGEEPMYRWTSSTPGQMGMFPANALAFRKGYIKEGTAVLHEERTFQHLIEREVPKITEENSFDPNRDNYNPNPEQGVSEYSPLTYLAGPVEVVYDGEPNNTYASPLLNDLVETSKNKVTSITGELTWDYGQGICLLDAPKAQGICGFPEQKEYKLSDITMTTSNDYVVINVVSLDDKSIKDSERLLIQVGTVYRPKGWKEVATTFSPTSGSEEIEGYRIESLGSMPWMCASTEVKIEIKNKHLKSARTLTSAGYEHREFMVIELSDGIALDLPNDAMYVVLDTRPSAAPTGWLERNKDHIQVCPNPNDGTFSLSLPNHIKDRAIDQIMIKDLLGKSIQSLTYYPDANYELRAHSGPYFLQFVMDDGTIHTKRMLVN